MRTLIVIAMGAVLLFSIKATAQDARPVIGVRTFENPPGCINPSVGDSLTELFITELMKTGKYRLVEREDIDDLVDEIELGQSAFSDKNTAVPKGFFKGVEYLLLAKVTNYGEVKRLKGGVLVPLLILPVGLGVSKDEAYVRIDFRIVDATTREIAFTGYGDGRDKTSSLSLGLTVGAVNVSNREFLGGKLGRATLQAVHEAISRMDSWFLANRTSGARAIDQAQQAAREKDEAALLGAPGSILAVASDQLVVVSLGSRHGLKPGDTLRVLKQDSVADSKGNVVFTEERQVGMLTVTEVQPDRSKTMVATGSGFEEGYIVRR